MKKTKRSRIIRGIRGITVGLALILCGVLGYGTTAAARSADVFYAVQQGNFPLTGMPGLSVKMNNTESYVQTGSPVPAETTGQLVLLGCIPLRDVRIEPTTRQTVTLCGTPFGLKLYADGALIIGLVEVDAMGGNVCPAKEAGLRVGDVIRAVNGQKVCNNLDASHLISQCGGASIALTVERQGKEQTMTLNPVYSPSCDSYKAGLWIRDSCAGIGTMTFVTDQGVFAGLGHGINDQDTETLMPLEYGEIVPVKLVGVTKGVRGVPGELRGYFASDLPLGQLRENRENGVYGAMNSMPEGSRIDVALRQEVCCGEAQMLTTVDGGAPRWFSVEIEHVYCDEQAQTQNMVIHITDPELLELTGGIVQGQSGSPLVQNGKLIGAVTHVFVHDPTRGYAVFAENMLNAANISMEKAS